MTEKRYKRLVSSIDYYYCIDTNDDKGLTEEDMLNRLNEQDERIKELEKENKNQNNILEDFMVMLNRLQAEPHNKSLPLMARDMLRMMGKDIMGDSE